MFTITWIYMESDNVARVENVSTIEQVVETLLASGFPFTHRVERDGEIVTNVELLRVGMAMAQAKA